MIVSKVLRWPSVCKVSSPPFARALSGRTNKNGRTNQNGICRDANNPWLRLRLSDIWIVGIHRPRSCPVWL